MNLDAGNVNQHDPVFGLKGLLPRLFQPVLAKIARDSVYDDLLPTVRDRKLPPTLECCAATLSLVPLKLITGHP